VEQENTAVCSKNTDKLEGSVVKTGTPVTSTLAVLDRMVPTELRVTTHWYSPECSFLPDRMREPLESCRAESKNTPFFFQRTEGGGEEEAEQSSPPSCPEDRDRSEGSTVRRNEGNTFPPGAVA
jgi:hypothetical protein